MKIRHPMRLRHPVNYMTRSYWNVKMVFVVHPCGKSWWIYLCVYDTYSSIEIHIIYCHTFSIHGLKQQKFGVRLRVCMCVQLCDCLRACMFRNIGSHGAEIRVPRSLQVCVREYIFLRAFLKD